jgi:hypothetical protein
MQTRIIEARRLVNLFNSGTFLTVIGRTASTGHTAGSTTLLRVDLSHDRVGNTLPVEFVSK